MKITNWRKSGNRRHRSYQNISYQTHILLDPLYNGKMMESFFNEQRSELDGDVLAYHSGGLFGWQGIIPKWHNQVDFKFLDTNRQDIIDKLSVKLSDIPTMASFQILKKSFMRD